MIATYWPIALNTALCGALVFLGFCRLHKSSHSTPALLRWGIALRTAGAFWVLLDPLVWGYTPSNAVLMLLAGALVTQIAMRELWRYGSPDGLKRVPEQ